MENKQAYRHGDVDIIPVGKLPDGETEEVTSKVLAYGEATGHHHTLSCEKAFVIMKGFDEKKYFALTAPAKLRHQEHKEIIIAPGVYEIKIEREYDYFENDMRKVID